MIKIMDKRDIKQAKRFILSGLKKEVKNINLSGKEKYFCSKCKKIHNRFRNHKSVKIFILHSEYALEIDNSKQFKNGFKKSWKRHSTSKDYRSHLN